jgi:Flp pilus assembly protein TadG
MTKAHGFSKGFLGRLLRNRAGNTLSLVAAGLIPMLGLIGGGIDMSRIYLTKARLQQACDAGALAGRKMMGSGAWTANSGKPNTTAVSMFDANFLNGAYGTSGRTRTFAEDSGKVTGTASVQVPMTIMRIFGQGAKTINVTCDAEMRIPNTDVMFVLDTTGSMASKATVLDTMTKIEGLRFAVKCFYEALAKIDIPDANCGSTPTGGNSATVQLRFGFVPYSSNVNVGGLLQNSWMADNWTYQSRVSTATGGWVYYSGDSTSRNFTDRNSCPANTKTTVMDQPSAGLRTTNGDWFTCTLRGNGNYDYTRNRYTDYVEQPGYTYTYQPVTFDVSALKAGGSSWNSSVNLPVGYGNASTSVGWDGCIEERQAWRNTDGNPLDDYSPIPSSAYDLNIDMVPTSDPATRWGPLLPNAVWGRYDSSGNYYPSLTTTSDLSRNYSYACPQPSRKLTQYSTASGATNFQNYVNSLSPNGNTYHDIGLVWGARLLSPTGLFASENAFTPQGGQIERNLIFMTDGDTVTSNTGYTAHGVAWWDRRETTTASAPSNTILDNTVNARMDALCSAIKNMNITLWVISYGSGVSSAAQTRLQNCASSGRFYTASNSAALIANFKSIADEISQLRLTN